MLLLYNAGQLVTPLSNGEFQVLEPASIASENGNIIFTGSSEEGLSRFSGSAQLIDLQGKIVLPGFVDSHTHAVFDGDRCAEFLMRLEGATYQQIAAAGGGIQSTVRATRQASAEALERIATRNLGRMLAFGTTTVEIKSGYGLNWSTEKKILDVIGSLKKNARQDIVATFLGAHDFPPDISREVYIRQIIDEMLPHVAKQELAQFCDVFCDQGYYTPGETRAICRKAKELGLRIKVHVDELADVNGAALAAEVGALSADHLIHANEEGIRKMAAAGVVAVLLPGTSFSLKCRKHAPARKMIDLGVRIALATDFNPGTCYCHSMLFILQLGTLLYSLTPAEAITAATLNAARAIAREKTLGSLEIGKQMDCLIFDLPHYGYLFYNLGITQIDSVIKKGRVEWNKNQNQL